MIRTVCICVVLCMLSFTVSGRIITVTVVDAVTKSPVPGVEVAYQGSFSGTKAVTDAAGKVQFDFTIPYGGSVIKFTITPPATEKRHKPTSITINTAAYPDGAINYVVTLEPLSNAEREAIDYLERAKENTGKARMSSPVWGPYQLFCSTDPAAGVAEFKVTFVKDDQTLLDYVSNACVGSATNAIDTLTEMLVKMESLSSRNSRMWTGGMRNGFTGQNTQTGKRADTVRQLYADNKLALDRSARETVEKLKEFAGKLKGFYQAAQAFGGKCLLDGVKGYFLAQLPPDIQKLASGVEGVAKAYELLNDKLPKMQRVIDAGVANASSEDKKLFTDLKDIKDIIQNGASGLGGLVSIVSNPAKLLPLELQMSLVLETIEDKMKYLISDCNIRECDLLLRDGIAAGQQALLLARKEYAQNQKRAQKENVSLADQATFRSNASAAYEKEQRVKSFLATLGGYCARLQPYVTILNDRVQQYEAIYSKGLDAVEACKHEEAKEFANQLAKLENGNCGHFFPSPYGKTMSADLLEKISRSVLVGLCNTSTNTQSTAGWAGTWIRPDADAGSFATTGEDGNGQGLMIRGNWKATTSWFGCTADDPDRRTKLTCKYSDKYEDQDKTVETAGVILFELSGDALHVTQTEKGAPKVAWKQGITPYMGLVNSAWHDGSVWKATWRRKK